MNEDASGAPVIYETSPDRLGLAIGLGSLLGGLVVMLLVLMGGGADPLALAGTAAIGTVFMALGMVAVAGPLWLVLHAAGFRRARHAALVGASSALVLFVAAQTHGFGLGDAPVEPGRTLAFRWASALLTSLILAGTAAGIGAAMWRVAYRRKR